MKRHAITDEEIEQSLQQELRMLPMPDSTISPVRHFRLIWTNYDLVLKYLPLSAVELSSIASFYAERQNVTFEEALREVVVPLRERVNVVIEAMLADLNSKRPRQES